jgi:hypothetical protein
MKTVLYQDIQNQAAEVAGRTRDKIPVKEALMLQGFAATALREVWNGQYQWPELIPAILAVAVANGGFSKNEGQPNEIGDVLGVYTDNPQNTTQFLALRFEEQNGAVWLPDGGPAQVWVEYMAPCPDLNAMNANTNPTLLNYPVPARFRNYLAWTAGGHLVRADGQVAQGDEFMALAQSEITIELRRVTPVPRRTVRQRSLYEDAKALATAGPGGGPNQ